MRQIKITHNIKTRSRNIDRYFLEIKRFEVLPPSEEVHLAQQIKKGCKKSKEKLINHNLRFVVSVAKTYNHLGMELADLIEAGNEGLITAAENFDETKGFKFISYAVWWIRQAIIDEMTKHLRTIRVPSNVIQNTGKLTELLSKSEHELSIYELMDMTDYTEAQIKSVLCSNSSTKSLDEEHSEGVTYSDSIGQDYDFDGQQNKSQLTALICIAMGSLSDNEATILKMYYGIGFDSTYTLDDIAQKLNLSRERVRQLKKQALKKLQKHKALKQEFELCL